MSADSAVIAFPEPPKKRLPSPPKGRLGRTGRTLWRRICADYELEDAGSAELELLAQACTVADRIAGIEAELEGAELLVKGGLGQLPKAHPLLRELREERRLFSGLLGQLGLPADESDWGSLTPSQRGRKAARARWDAPR